MDGEAADPCISITSDFLVLKEKYLTQVFVACLLRRERKRKTAIKQGGVRNWRRKQWQDEKGQEWQIGNPYAKVVERMMPPGPRQCRVSDIGRRSNGITARYAETALSCRNPVC